MNRKTQGIIAAAVKLGAAENEDFSGGGVVQTLKELAVAIGAAESVKDIAAQNVSGVLGYIAENGEDIVYPEPTGTKSITENGKVDVKDYANAEVAVPASAVVSGTLSITENGTYDVTDKANAVVNVAASAEFAHVNVINNSGFDVSVFGKIEIDNGVLRRTTKSISKGNSDLVNIPFSSSNSVDEMLRVSIMFAIGNSFSISASSGTTVTVLEQTETTSNIIFFLRIMKTDARTSNPEITIAKT